MYENTNTEEVTQRRKSVERCKGLSTSSHGGLTRQDRVDAHALGGKLKGEVLGEGVLGGLGHTVAGHRGGGDGHDGAH